MIEIQQASESLATTDGPRTPTESGGFLQQPVANPLMISFTVIMGHIVCDRVPQRCLPQEDHLDQTLGFN